MRGLFRTVVAALLQATAVLSQSIYPSNSTSDLLPPSRSPRFLLNGTEIPDSPPVRLAPLGPYAQQSHHAFVSTDLSGKLIHVDASNANNDFPVPPSNFFYISCDPEDYNGNMHAAQVFTIAIQNTAVQSIILYSTTSDHCAATGLEQLPQIGAVLTTTDTMVAQMLASMDLQYNSPGVATILPDLNSYTNATGEGGFSGYSWSGKSPTTAVAMIILYSITGVITALFLTIIVTGAIRAHRHPERYGPRNIMGRGRQSRAKGIARAMLDTIPIVKFGDRSGEGGTASATTAQKPVSVAGTQDADVEMATDTKDRPTAATDTSTNKAIASEDPPPQTTTITGITPAPAPESTKDHTTDTTHDTTTTATSTTGPTSVDDANNPSCSICTEDFLIGADVRVLPCNHQFHPECVDPWLLNVSGTCPLCRIDLRPPQEDEAVADDDTAGGEGPQRSGSRDAVGTGLGQDSYQPQAQHVSPHRPGRGSNLSAGFRPGEDFIMAGSLRSGRSRRTSGSAAPGSAGGTGEANGSAFAGLRRALGGSREERVAALRRFRAQQSDSGTAAADASSASAGTGAEEERRGLAARLRERMRVRTERREDLTRRADGEDQTGGLTLGQVRSREHVDGRPL